MSLPENFDWPQLIWLLMALLLVAGAGTGFRRFRHDAGRSIASLMIWGAIVVAIVAVYTLLN